MEELIKEAESLYQQIDKIQLDLIKSRLDESEGQKAKAIDEMETAMCAVFQFLKCIIDRKDNIVDLGEVWHWYKDEKPRHMDDLCFFVLNGIPVAGVHNMIGLERFIDSCYGKNFCYGNKFEAHSIRWAYLDDLLPKGGE